MSNWKDMIINVIVGLIKKTLNWIFCIKVSLYFANLFRNFGKNIKAKVDLSHYTTKTNIINISQVDT